mgnify:CR=1 FL=1
MNKRTSRKSAAAAIPVRTEEEISDVTVAEEMATSFTAYAMSTIVARALPDVRDGLKPVHRRILYSMYQAKMFRPGPYKKCARVVGDTMGRYHPHGDSAIYETLVRLGQPFSLRMPLIDGHGNFGSQDDGPAAARYTECRVHDPGRALLDDLNENTVDWVATYDNLEMEPMVLPAAFPNLLVNGGSGIAVGFMSNIPPHNLAEVVNAIEHAVRNPKATNKDLRAHIAGPDFPTGGDVVDVTALDQIYETGRGTFKLRCVFEIQDVSAKRKAIVVTKLPYQIGPERVVDEVRTLVRDKKLVGLTEVRDLSGRDSGLKLVFDVKPSADAEAVCAELLARTSLETTVTSSFVVLDGGKPVVADLKHLCMAYVTHRRDVVRRRSQFRVDKADRRIHLLEGLLRALDAIDDVVTIIRAASDDGTARQALMEHPDLLLTELQADHVLDLQLRRLTRLSATKLTTELNALQKTAAKLRGILRSPKRLDDIVVAELHETVATFGSDRVTGLGVNWTPQRVAAQPAAAAAATQTPCTVIWSPDRRHAAVAADTAGLLASRFVDTTEEGVVWALGDNGVIYVADVAALPRIAASNSPTVPAGAATIAALAGAPTGVEIVAVLCPNDGVDLGIVTANGVVKRVAADTVATRNNDWSVISLAQGDTVKAADWAPDDAEFVLISTTAQMLRTPAGKVRPQGRSAGGVAGMKLGEGTVVAAAITTPDASVITAVSSGRAKQTALAEFPLQNRGGAGTRCMRFTAADTELAYAFIGTNPVDVSGTKIPEGKRDGSGTPVKGQLTFGFNAG